MRHSSEHHSSPEWRRLGRCWLAAMLVVVITGPILAVAGVGGSLLGLAAFLVIFAVVVVPLIFRELRPGVSLVSSSQGRHR